MMIKVKIPCKNPGCEDGFLADDTACGECDEGIAEVLLPGRFEVCDRCHGKGTHCNPNIDGNGLTAEDFAEDPDFEEAYFEGRYDVTCEECKGLRVVEAVDVDNLTPEQRADNEAAEAHQATIDRWNYEDAYIRRMESGGY